MEIEKRFTPFMVEVVCQWQANIVIKFLQTIYPEYAFSENWFKFDTSTSICIGFSNRPTYTYSRDIEESNKMNFLEFVNIVQQKGFEI